MTMEDWRVMKARSRTEKTTKMRTKTAVSRKVVVRSSWPRRPRLLTDHISRAPDGLQQRRLEAAIDLGPEPRHMDVDDVGLRVEVVVPDVFKQHGAGNHLAGVLHQILEQAELARLQQDGLAAPLALARQPVEAQIPDLEAGGAFARTGAPREHLHTGEQLGEGVRLGEIVVAAGPEAGHPGVDLPQRRQDQDRGLVA